MMVLNSDSAEFLTGLHYYFHFTREIFGSEVYFIFLAGGQNVYSVEKSDL